MLRFFKKPVLFVSYLSLMMFFSCKKEATDDVPRIQLISPVSMTQYMFGDTAKIRALISDNQLIERVEVKIKNDENIPVYEKTIQVNSVSFELDLDIVLDDSKWNGTFYFDIRAFDAYDYGHVFRYFNLENKGAGLRGIIVFEENESKTTAYAVKSSEVTEIITFQSDLLKSQVNSNGTALFLCPEYDGSLFAFDTLGNVLWNFKGNSVPSVPYFIDAHFSANELIVSTTDGRILGFDASGNRVVENTLDEEFRPGRIFRHEDLVVFEKVRNSSGQVFVRNEFYPSGLFKGEVAFPYGRISSFQKSNWNKIVLTSNSEKDHFVLEFNTTSQFIEVLYQTSDLGDFGESVSLGNGAYLLIKGDHLYKFDLSNRTLSLFKSDIKSRLLRYDEASNLIWYASSNELIAISVLDGSNQVKMDVGFEIESFELFYP